MSNVMNNSPIIGLLLLMFSVICQANEKIPENETTVFNETFSWQAMANISVLYNPSLLKGQDQENVLDYTRASLLLDIYYKGFFIQSSQRSTSDLIQGAELGYQLVVTPKWELDLISKTYIAGYDPEEIIKDSNKSIPTLQGLKERNPGDGIGLRYSRYHHNSVLSVDFATLAPLSSANGWIADVFYSYVLPYRNWDIYLSSGYTHYSERVMDYFYGVNSNEITPVRPLHESDSGYRIQLELFAQHPISENWSFHGGITHNFYSNSTKDSPLVDTQHISQVMLGVIYVF
jgi:outer membrane scaffolding protein for murein synthesis (MipA/OmpV family)